MKVIIDTNIYLNFYRKRADQSIEFLDPLTELVDTKKFELLLPTQVKGEFLYNKNRVIIEQIIALTTGLQVQAPLPDFVKGSQESKSLIKAIKTLKRIQIKTVKQYMDRATNPKSRINTDINRLFRKAVLLDSNQASILKSAYSRVLKGLPPIKKKNKFGELGDSIIWETLLRDCDDDDLIIIAADGDWSEKEKPNIINKVLKDEWSKKTNGKKLKLYNNLGKFINDNSPKSKKPISKQMIDKDEQLLFGGISGAARVQLANNATTIKSFGEQVTTTFGITTQICNCCGKTFRSDPYSFATMMGNGNKCPDCVGLFVGECKICMKCGKHYHDSLCSFSLTTFENACPDCQSNPAISLDDSYLN